MLAHVKKCAPLEGCGVLMGRGETVDRVLPVANAARSANRFRMDPAAQLRAFQEMEDHGLALLGIFHSHPVSDDDRGANAEVPSDTDVREAAYPVVHVIWSQRSGKWRARGFWIEGGTVSEVPLVIAAVE
jgi:proteasome lid subunit RPN8/RPN11